MPKFVENATQRTTESYAFNHLLAALTNLRNAARRSALEAGFMSPHVMMICRTDRPLAGEFGLHKASTFSAAQHLEFVQESCFRVDLAGAFFQSLIVVFIAFIV